MTFAIRFLLRFVVLLTLNFVTTLNNWGAPGAAIQMGMPLAISFIISARRLRMKSRIPLRLVGFFPFSLVSTGYLAILFDLTSPAPERGSDVASTGLPAVLFQLAALPPANVCLGFPSESWHNDLDTT